jgi:pimeloyl-ACP methyl ester carboxylesterase
VKQYQQMVREGYQVSIGDDYSLKSDRIGRGVTYWITLPIKYFSATVLDGFGTSAWNDMLRRTQVAYPDRLDMNIPAATNLTVAQRKRFARAAAAGLPVFVEALHERQLATNNLEVALVGHSMGAIILNRVIREANLEFTNIVYMGAACSYADFTASVIPYMKDHKNAQFYNLSLHPVAEAGEWYPFVADMCMRGSLLVWIDNMFSHPVSEEERTFGRWRNLYLAGPTGEPNILRLFANDEQARLKDRLHFHAFSVGFGETNQLRAPKYQWNEDLEPNKLTSKSKRCDNPLKHGDFSEMPYWAQGFWKKTR